MTRADGRMTRSAPADCEMRVTLPATLEAVEGFFVEFQRRSQALPDPSDLLRGRVAGARGADQRRAAWMPGPIRASRSAVSCG